MSQFTASEVRDAITWKYGDKLTRISAMLTAFADLLEAQERAVPVAHRWRRNGELASDYWITGVPSERACQAAKNCSDKAKWEVEYAYAATTVTTASVTDADDAARLDWLDTHAFTAYRTRDIETAKLYPHVTVINEDLIQRCGQVRPTLRAAIDAARAKEPQS